MKAAQINEYGGPEVIEIKEVTKPSVTEGRVLIDVRAASLNPFDAKLRSGTMKDSLPLKFPATLGGDLAGVVVEVGEDVTDFAIGDKVFGQANVVGGNTGAFAEYASTKASVIARAPQNVDFLEAASLPLVGVSALQALNQHIQLEKGQRIFIHGGGGGIGTVAIQIAKHIGAYVATTATGEGLDKVKNLGADQIIDYKVQDFAHELADFDAVFDTVGGDDFSKSLGILKKGGTAVSMAGHVEAGVAEEIGVSAISQSTKVTNEILDKLRELVESGVVKPQVAKVFQLGQIQDAFRALETGTIAGKVVVKIK